MTVARGVTAAAGRAALAITLLLSPAALAAETAPTAAEMVQPPKPAADDKCPVCGMFVAKYPEWVATVVYDDGHAHHFDGAKDMFKYLNDLPRYAPDHSRDTMTGIFVTEYYGLAMIRAPEAVYVIGSDVLGPMGHEFVPLRSREEAKDFAKDHGAKAVLTFDEVTPAIVHAVDHGAFDELPTGR